MEKVLYWEIFNPDLQDDYHPWYHLMESYYTSERLYPGDGWTEENILKYFNSSDEYCNSILTKITYDDGKLNSDDVNKIRYEYNPVTKTWSKEN